MDEERDETTEEEDTSIEDEESAETEPVPEVESEPEPEPEESIYDSVSRLDEDELSLTPKTSSNPRSHKQRATSDVRSWLSLGLAIPLYGLVVGGAHAAPEHVSRLLLERGWIPHVIMVLSCWCLAILLVKTVGLKVQRKSFTVSLLPNSTPRISTQNVTQVLDHIEMVRRQNVDLRASRSILVERVVRILEHFAARGDVSETATVNNADADADAAAVASSFSLVKVLVWAIPILGFIGTVVGIGVAVGGFSQSLEGAEQLDSIKSSLGEVTSGLAVAFDTTLVALVASILVMLPTSWVQKAEEQLVNDVDDYCVTDILRRMVSAEELAAAETAEQPETKMLTADELTQVIVDKVAQPLADMLEANTRLMNRLVDDHAAMATVNGAITEQLTAFAEASRQIGPEVKEAVTQLGRATELAERTSDAMTRTSDQLCREIGASRQLMSLLAAGMGNGASAPKSSNGSNGHGLAHAALEE